MSVGNGLVVSPATLFTYKRMNARRDAVMREAGEKGGLQYSDHELRRMGDGHRISAIRSNVKGPFQFWIGLDGSFQHFGLPVSVPSGALCQMLQPRAG